MVSASRSHERKSFLLQFPPLIESQRATSSQPGRKRCKRHFRLELSDVRSISTVSNQPPLRPGSQNVRVVVLDAVHPGADSTPLVGASAGFAHQLEEPRDRRHRIEPVRKPPGVDYHRLSVLDSVSSRRNRIRDGARTMGTATPPAGKGEHQGRYACKRPHLFGQPICHFEITAEGICQLNLPWRPAFRFEDAR